MYFTRRTKLRVAAILFGITLILGAEGVFRVMDWGSPVLTDDPFVGFDDVVPLFVTGESDELRQIAPGRLRFFAPDSFPTAKGRNTFRVFCLGGSTVQGRPFSIETSFTTWLKHSLHAADPSRHWEVINCGGVSYAAYRLLPILGECLGYEPDLIILCTGHNEFLEDRTYHDFKSPGSIHRLLGHSRLYSAMRTALTPAPAAPRTSLSVDVQARLDFQNGLQLYERDDQWHRDVAAHFESALTGMIHMCRAKEVPLLLLKPPVNLADSPPFKSQPSCDERTLEHVNALLRAARSQYKDDLTGAIATLREAVRADPRIAANLYELAQAYEAAGQTRQARELFRQARDEDVCPLRMTSRLEEALTSVAASGDVRLFDVHSFLSDHAPGRILGNGPLVDHVHPSIRSHQLIADELVSHIEAMGLVRPQPNWKQRAAAAHKAHFDTLDRLYFLKGERTLKLLQDWARGRAHNLPVRPTPQ